MANNFNLPILLIFIFIQINCIRQQSLGTGSGQTNAQQWNSPKQCQQIGEKYFNPNILQCSNCPGGMVPSGNGIECECPDGAIPRIDGPNHFIECQKCENGLAKSRNGLHCVECLGTNGGRVNEGGKCPKCEDGIIQLDLAKNDSSKFVEKCIKCPQGMSPIGNKNECLECATQLECFCKNNNSSSTICAEFPISSAAFSIPIYPFSTTNLQQFQSEFLWKTLRNAEYRCKLGIMENCQQLGNICVLQNYSREREGACNILDQIRTSWTTKPEIEQILPKLFYPNFEASVEIFRENAIGAEFNVLPQRENSQLEIIATAFDQDGIFLGQIFANNDPFLQMCPLNGDSNQFGPFQQFGRFYRQKCQISLDQIIRWNRSWNWNRPSKDGEQFNGTIFYELFIRYRDEQGQIMMHPIPVLNENIRGGDQYTGGIYPNRIEQIRRDSRFLLTRRFYILDIQKSAPNSAEDGQSEQILMIRVPKRINLHIHFQPNGDGRIFIPYLQISHEQYFLPTNSSENALGQTILDTEFTVEYHVDNYSFDKTIEVLMAISCSMAAIWAALQTYSWGRRSGKMVIDASTIVKLLLFGAECIGNVFLFLMGAAAIWLIFAYKLQSHIYYIPLSGNQENSFIAYMISATALKGIALVHTILTLFLVQTFFIDWERPRFLGINETTFLEDENGGGGVAKPQKRGDANSVVIWRTYLIANEWNELQLYRKTHIGLQLVAMLFLMEYLEFGNWAKVQPGFERINQPNEIAETRMSRFGVDLFFYFCIGMGQWLLQVIIMERLVDPFRNFMDLCSVANISVLAMTNPLRGFYIHGRSVHGFADTDMLQMNTFLQREKENLCALRGLESGSDLQTFLCNLPRLFRERVDQILAGLNTTTGGAAAAMNLRGTRAAGGAANFDRTTIRMQHQAKVYGELNDFLKDFINRVDPQCGEYQITDSRFIEDLLGIELADTSRVGTFKKDPSEMAYSSAFLYGNEWAIMSFEMLFFSLIDMFWQNRVLAAFCTYLCSKMTIQLTNVYFTHQLARSSLVDSRFLI